MKSCMGVVAGPKISTGMARSRTSLVGYVVSDDVDADFG